MPDFSDFIVFADESGDHGLETIDPQFPVFSLVFCIFEKDVYSSRVEPAVRDFKFRYFGHDAIILHEREIRKQEGEFLFLRGDPERRAQFFADLDALMREIEMQAFVSVILKERLLAKYANPWNPYEIAMHFCMEKLCRRLEFKGQKGRKIHVLFESRGKTEDRALELEFRRITANAAGWGWKRIDFSVCEFEPVFVPKAANLAGHQITDLIARPLALRALRPDQPNRAVDAVIGRVLDHKIFP